MTTSAINAPLESLSQPHTPLSPKQINGLGRNLVFLISLPRSGSTLLQMILAGSSEIHTTVEPWLMLHPLHAMKADKIESRYDQNLAVMATREFLARIPEKDDLFYKAVRAYGLTLYNRSLEMAGRRIFLDKTPRYYSIIPELLHTFPAARFIILLRNPLAVLSSVLRTWFDGDSHHLVQTSNHHDLLEGPRYLVEGIELLKDKATVVHYENLVTDPHQSISTICQFLDIPFNAHLLKYGRKRPFRGKLGDQVGIHRHNGPVDHHINKWIDYLAKAKRNQFAVEYLNQLGAETITQLGYDASSLASSLTVMRNATQAQGGPLSRQRKSSFLLTTHNIIKSKYDHLIASLQNADPETIVASLNRFITENPDFAECHNDLGVIYANMGRHEDALTHYRHATALDVQNVIFQKNLADFLFVANQNPHGALKIYTQLLKQDRQDIEVLQALGHISKHVGQVADARYFFERILELDPGNVDATKALRQRRPFSNDISADNDHYPSKAILVATSLAPHAIALQRQALQSWVDLGWDVVSLNSPEEIRDLKKHFPHVRFYPVSRNSQAHFGKPYIYFDDFMAFFKTADTPVGGIINSDIHIKARHDINSFIRTEATGSLLYGSRLDIESLEDRQGDFYPNGFDFFFFDPCFTDIYPKSIVSLGVTWWDYWAVLIPALMGRNVKRLVSPLAYHPVHPNRWDPQQWHYVGRHIADHLKSADRTQSPPWAMLREIMANAAALQNLEKPPEDQRSHRWIYNDIDAIGICLLDFLDCISTKILLPWDDGLTKSFYKAKGSNFYQNIFETRSDDEPSPAASQLAHKCARLVHRAIDHYHSNDMPAAQQCSAEALDYLADDQPALNLAGILAWQESSVDKAVRYFNAALRINPNDRTTVFNCAAAMMRLNQSAEARQISAYYLRLNPGDLAFGEWYRTLEGDSADRMPTDFILPTNERGNRLPVLVYQMGEVGSTSIVEALQWQGFPTWHVHTLTWAGIERAEALYRSRSDQKRPGGLEYYRGIRSHIDRLGSQVRWKIITLVRDPLRRYISDIFQNFDRVFPGLDPTQADYLQTVVDHIQAYLEEFNPQEDHACRWFDLELKQVFDFDIFSVPFDTARGYQFYRSEQADILLIRLEDLTSCGAEALGHFLDHQPFALDTANRGMAKPYAALYRKLLSELTLDDQLIDKFYQNRLVRHFYSETEIEAFKHQWCGPRSTQKIIRPQNELRVSAVISAYCSEPFIEARLQNLVDQTLFRKGQLEIIVIDSNSPQNEKVIVKRFAEKYQHIIYLRTQMRETVYQAWNRGIAISRGTYFVNANSDDRFADDALDCLANALDDNTEYDAAYGDWLITRTPNDTFTSARRKRLFVYPEFHPGLLFYLQVTSHATFIRRSVFQSIGNFDGALTVFGDREFMFRFAAKGFKALKLAKTIGLYLENPTSVERANKDIGHTECTALYDQYMASDNFSRLMGGRTGMTPKALSSVYTEVGCFGMQLYNLDGETQHALGSPARLFAKAIECDPENILALNNMGVIAHYWGERRSARRFFNSARTLATNVQQRVIDQNLAQAMLNTPSGELLTFLFPQGYRSFCIREQTIEDQSKTSRATAGKCPDHAIRIKKQKKNPRTRRDPKDTPLNNPPTETLGNVEALEQAQHYYRMEDYPAAIRLLSEQIATHPDNWAAYPLLIDLQQMCEDPPDMPNALRSLENRSDLPAEMLALIGMGYEGAGELDQARRFAAASLRKDDRCARAWNLRGIIAYRCGNFKSATRHFRKATDSDPDWGDPWTNLGTIFWEQKASNEALGFLQKGFQLSPAGPNVAAAYHIAISKTGQFAKARPLLEEVVQRYPDFPKARFFLIDILIKLEAYQAALDHIETVWVRFGGDPSFLSAAAAVRAKIGPLKIKAKNHQALSLCMIVKNEEKPIARCLHSLKPLVDEIIVVDTGSTDNTKAIAQLFGARVYDYTWSDDFAAARNFSISKANGRWVFIMDADEILSSRDHRRMKKLLRRHREADTAFSITTRNYTFLCNLMDWIANDGAYPEEAGTGWTPSEKVRLFPNRPNIRFEYPVHEVVRPSLDREGIKIKKCPVPVHHYGQLDQVKAAQKGAAYYNIGIKKIDAMAQDPQAIQELAAQAMLLGRQEEAVDLWQRLSMLEPDNAHAYVNLATAYDRLGNHTNARSAAIRAADLDKGLKEAHFNAARAELHLGRASEAAARLKPLVLKHRHYYAAEFMLGCARICAGEMREGINIIAKLKSTSLWHTIVYAFQEIAQSLLNAERTAFSRKIYRAASNLGLSIETATDPADPAPALFVAAQIEG